MACVLDFSHSDTRHAMYSETFDTLQELDIDSYSLISNFPRKTFTRDGEDMTLLEAGVHPNGALFVQIEDS